MVNLSKQNITN